VDTERRGENSPLCSVFPDPIEAPGAKVAGNPVHSLNWKLLNGDWPLAAVGNHGWAKRTGFARILETPNMWSANQVFGRLSPFGFQGFYGARRGRRERGWSRAFHEVEDRDWTETRLASATTLPPSRTAITRRAFFSASIRLALAAGPLLPTNFGAAATARQTDRAGLVIDDTGGFLARTQAPVAGTARLTWRLRRVAAEGRLQLVELENASAPVPVQVLGSEAEGRATLCWLMLPGAPGRRVFNLRVTSAVPACVEAERDSASGQFDFREVGTPVLRYNYATIEPGERLPAIAPANQIYARARSDYIHPLYGPSGEILTKDWSVDHPHHRGIYWAWPEVDWRGQRGDLHALQRVFARPTGQCRTSSGPVFAQLDAENLWRWEDREPVVRERAMIRVYRQTPQGRLVDLEFHFVALGDPVQVARRGTDAYGGLNLRLAAVEGQRIAFHTDGANAVPRRAWAELSGAFSGAASSAGLVVIQHAANACYPGEWVQYPDLNWFQPTFPAGGTRYEIGRDAPLWLRFRLWIHPGASAAAAVCSDQWDAAHAISSPLAAQLALTNSPINSIP
jgi:hypothetical protein